MRRRWHARVRGSSLFGPGPRRKYSRLTAGQPLVLEREPDNPVDPNAVVVADMMGVGIAYVEREVAAQIAPLMDSGQMVMAKVTAPPYKEGTFFHPAEAVLWIDGTAEIADAEEREKEKAE